MFFLQRILPALLTLTLLASCGARWQSLKPHTAGEVDGVDLELGEHHGHRDLPGSFDGVWDAAVEALHSTGIGVPRSVAPTGTDATIDLHEVLLRVRERAPGRICVIVRFHRVSKQVGRERAAELLDELQARLHE